MKILLRTGAIAGFLWMTAFALADAPDWLLNAAKVPTPEQAKKAPALVLLDEQTISVNANGSYAEVHRRVVRILHNAGTEAATGSVAYLATADKIDYVGAWLVRQENTVETRKKSEWADVAINAAGAVVDEQRACVVSLSDKAVAADIFGYETRKQGTLLVAQLSWDFQSGLPVLSEKVKLTLPPGFGIEQKTSGPMPLTGDSSRGQVWSWSLGERPYHPEEPYEHPQARTDALLMVRLIPPAGAVFAPRTFASWAEVVDFYQTLSTGQCDTSAALAAKVHGLAANQTDKLAKIQALGGYVQKLRYVAYNQGLRFGYGYKPRKASLVFSTGFGDCKDKANLLVAMLGEAGIKAHLASAFLGQDRFIFPDFPTPAQFNHAIVAIEVGEEIQLPAVVQTEKYGRLLFFDATNPYTKVGDLSDSLQGGLVHVEIPGNATLTALPQFSAEADFCYERRLELALTPEGAAQIAGKVTAVGQTGARLRGQFEQANMPKEMEAMVTEQLNDKFRGAAVLAKQTEDDPVSGKCTLAFTCVQPKYVQWLQGQTGIVKLDLLSRKYLPNFSEKERQLPIGLPPLAIKDEIVLHIPQGMVASEFPAASSLESPYGSCVITCESAGDTLVFKRQVVLRESRIPAADYDKLRKFFSDIAKADRAAVLLKRQG